MMLARKVGEEELEEKGFNYVKWDQPVKTASSLARDVY